MTPPSPCSLCGENCWPPCWRSWAVESSRMQNTPVTSCFSAGFVFGLDSQPTVNNLLIYMDGFSAISRKSCSGGAGVEPPPRFRYTQRVREKNFPAALLIKGGE